MDDSAAQYPKFLAFMQLFYPPLYKQISTYSDKSDLVEANLICSNNAHSFQAIVYSEDVTEDGELLDIYSGKNAMAPYSWDWRWVFALKIVYSNSPVFKLTFKQKVIALPSGKHPLSDAFFNVLNDEFKQLITDLNQVKQLNNIPIHDCFAGHIKSINLY